MKTVTFCYIKWFKDSHNTIMRKIIVIAIYIYGNRLPNVQSLCKSIDFFPLKFQNLLESVFLTLKTDPSLLIPNDWFVNSPYATLLQKWLGPNWTTVHQKPTIILPTPNLNRIHKLMCNKLKQILNFIRMGNQSFVNGSSPLWLTVGSSIPAWFADA